MIARLPVTRPRRAFSAREFAALEHASVFAGYPAATWAGDDVWKADGSPYFFTVEQYHRMIAAGLLRKSERVELIEGEVIEKMPIGDRHVSCVYRLNHMLTLRLGTRALVGPQCPIVLTTSEPEPDIAVLRARSDFYGTAKPRPIDVLLAIEVADSSLDYDLDQKARLYAENDIREYWVVDVTNDRVHVHTGPQPDGSWASVVEHGRGDTLSVAALVSVTVDELLP